MASSEGKHSDWLVAVQSGLEGEPRLDKSYYCLIHTVPNSLLSKRNRMFYHPEVISFGPYHFQRKHLASEDMELLKSEVARKMHHKIIRNGGSTLVGGLTEIVEELKKKEIQDIIKESYAKQFNLSNDVCAWMIVRDACLALEILYRYREDTGSDDRVPDLINSILSRERHHPLLTEIVKDMLKMENQIPFWALEEIRLVTMVSDDEFWFESALKNLSPIKAAGGRYRNYKKKYHILQLLHDYIIDEHSTTSSDNQSGRSSMSISALLDVVKRVSIFKIPYPRLCSPEICIKWLFRLLYAIILLLLSPVFVMFFIWYCIEIHISPDYGEIGKHVPTVEELKRLGVKFKKLKGDKIGISHIKFEESNSTLYLPQFEVDNRSEVILRNLIALEICSPEEGKPITRYAILMNDLINTSGDVGILRRVGIITSKLGSDDEIAQLWNSMLTSTEMPMYDSIDTAASSINRYRKKWWKVLWAQFIMVHCSKPWLFLSLLAGLILLVLTLVQVICLFESCQLK